MAAVRGSFVGHLVAGFFFLLFGVLTGLHCIHRSGCDTRLDPKFARRIFYGVLISTSAGIIGEGLSGFFFGDGFFNFIYHQASYFVFTCAASVGLLESFYLLPSESNTKFISIACLFHGILFNVHSMEQEESEAMAHVLLVYLYLSTSAMYAYSAYHPKDFQVVLGCCLMLVLIGIWYLNIAFIFFELSIFKLPRDNIPMPMFFPPLLVVEISAVLTLCYVGAVVHNKMNGITFETKTMDYDPVALT